MFARFLFTAILMSVVSASAAYADVLVLVSHEVKDFDAWKKGFDGDKAVRKKAGFKELFIARDTAKPNLIHLGFTAASAEKAKAFIENPKLKETMEKCGVISAPEIKIGTLEKK